MSSEFLSNTIISEHDVTLAIPGDPPSVRQRLGEAIEQLGYKVLGEHPLHARRIRQGLGGTTCSLNVVDSPTTLTVSLKQTNNVAVLATFSFEIKSYMRITKGDRQTLDREAEAIVALATERLAITACRSCGTAIDDESHFCRRCGAPLVSDVPELEVLRLIRGTRSGYQHLVFGILIMLLASLTSLPIFLVQGPKVWVPLIWIGIPFGCYGLFLLLQGIWQLHRTLNLRPRSNSSREARRVSATANTTALNPTPSPTYITEGTTELLIPVAERRVAETVRRKGADTDEIEADRLM